jgi:hypothetical protein
MVELMGAKTLMSRSDSRHVSCAMAITRNPHPDDLSAHQPLNLPDTTDFIWACTLILAKVDFLIKLRPSPY